jgi:hypothetical protein
MAVEVSRPGQACDGSCEQAGQMQQRAPAAGGPHVPPCRGEIAARADARGDQGPPQDTGFQAGHDVCASVGQLVSRSPYVTSEELLCWRVGGADSQWRRSDKVTPSSPVAWRIRGTGNSASRTAIAERVGSVH